MKHRYLFGICYGIFIATLTTYFLLDTFVITKTYQAVYTNTLSYTKNNVLNTSNNTSVEEENEQAEITDTTYKDSNIEINLSTVEQYNTTIYIADVKVSSIEYLKTALAQNSYGRNIKDTTSNMATSNNAILAINGDYYGFRNNGFVLRNGTLYRTSTQSGENDDLVIYNSGKFEIIDESNSNAENIAENGAWQIFSFGPGLVENGTISVSENDEVSQSMSSNPRTAIGYIDDLHYIFVVSDGRTTQSAGLSLYELATIMKSYGCTQAYNLDGGGSSTMWFNGKIVNNPTDGRNSGERSVSDIVYIGY